MASGQLRNGLGLPCYGLRPCLNPECTRATSYRGKGLCRVCQLDPAIRSLYPDLYPPQVGRINFRSARPPEATTALPGSVEKMDVIAWRIAHGYTSDHPLDACADSELPRGLRLRSHRERQHRRVLLPGG